MSIAYQLYYQCLMGGIMGICGWECGFGLVFYDMKQHVLFLTLYPVLKNMGSTCGSSKSLFM